jgi:uncharacterized membrane-anchored protein YjiN (DUF445 family)
VRLKLHSVNLAQRGAAWLASPTGHERLVQSGAGMVSWMVGAYHEDDVRRFVRRLSRAQFERLDLAPMLGRMLDWLVQDGRHQEILTQALRHVVVLLHDHRDTIRGKVQRESPWWLPGFIDDRIVQQMLDRIETLLMQMSLDPGHPLRGDFDLVLQRWSAELQTAPSWRRAVDTIREAAMHNEELQDYLYELWMGLVMGIESDLRDPASSIRAQLGEFVSGLAAELARDQAMQAVVNRWLSDSAVAIVQDHRHGIASLVSDTVASWDAQETSQRVELAIGHDLQYIRVNGTLVGGLVGLAIYALQHCWT